MLLKTFLKLLNLRQKKGKIIHVFGSAGQRDAGKRPLMGQLSAQFADTIVLTSEDPRSESAESIAQEIIAGMPKNSINVEVITDRQTAITHAVIQAKEGDTILITGKGHEKSMNMGQGEVQWSDHEAVLTALQIRNSNIETRNKSK